MSMFSLFTFGPLHNLHLRTSKLMMEFTVNYLLSNTLKAGEELKGKKEFVKNQLWILRRHSAWLSAIGKDAEVLVTETDFSREEHKRIGFDNYKY